MKTKIFVISGLGADETMFSELNIKHYELVHIKWVQPVKTDTLATYAQKLLPQITTEKPIVLGLSLGGMLALEVSKHIEPQCIIALSTVTKRAELPVHYKIAGFFNAHKWMPLKFLGKQKWLTHRLFGAKNKHSKVKLNAVLENIDHFFLKWALNAVLKWDNTKIPENLYRIHGTKDLILPRNKKGNYHTIIKGGTHLMVLNKPLQTQQAIVSCIED